MSLPPVYTKLLSDVIHNDGVFTIFSYFDDTKLYVVTDVCAVCINENVFEESASLHLVTASGAYLLDAHWPYLQRGANRHWQGRQVIPVTDFISAQIVGQWSFKVTGFAFSVS